MSHLSTDIQAHIAEGRRLVEALLAQQQVHFQGRTLNTPDESGIYAFSDRRTSKILYVGRTKKGTAHEYLSFPLLLCLSNGEVV